jgi:cytochrome c-type biogenesis protein CcmH/NrfG
MKAVIPFIALLFVLLGVPAFAQKRSESDSPAKSSRTLTIVTEPAAIVWLDEIRRGTTDNNGRLLLSTVGSGAHTLRVRANGFKESTTPVAAAAHGEVRVRLLRTTDQAELLFQQAESSRDTARGAEDRQKAADQYRQAIRSRAAYPSAHIGLARVLLDLNDTDGALNEIAVARRYRPSYPEASAVEGRVYRETGQTDEAIGSFNRAIRESHGFQPEAHVGLGRTYEEKGQYELAAREFQIAVNQLADTEPIIYQLLGAAYEKSGNPKEAIVAYESYLRLAPNGSQASAVRSIIEQLKSEQP